MWRVDRGVGLAEDGQQGQKEVVETSPRRDHEGDARMPPEFWLITTDDSQLVWSKELLAFIPSSTLNKMQQEQMAKLWFLDPSEARFQITELNALGCTNIGMSLYKSVDKKDS
jgi:hypothetical protein